MPSWSERKRHDQMTSRFREAMEANPGSTHEIWYSFGSRATRVRILGDRLAERLAPALCHLILAPDERRCARLRIDLWDQGAVGVDPDLDVQPDPLGVSSSFFMSEDQRHVTSVLQHSIASFDRQEQHIVGVTFDAMRISLYEWGRPLHIPLALWYNDRDLPLVHAALVSLGGRGILLAGPSEAGKTTSSLSCLEEGFRYLADDLVALQIGPDGAWGHSIYGSAFVDDDALARTTSIRGRAISGTYDYEDKKLVFISRLLPLRLMDKTRINAVALTSLGDRQQTYAEPAAKADSLMTLARSSLHTGVLSPARRGFESLGELVRRTPTFQVALGTDPQTIPARLRELLDHDLPPAGSEP